MRKDLDDVLLDIDKSNLSKLLVSLSRKGYLTMLKSSKGGSVYKIPTFTTNSKSLKQTLLPKTSSFSADLCTWYVGKIIYGGGLKPDDPRLFWLKPFIENYQVTKSVITPEIALFSPKWVQNEPFDLVVKDRKIAKGEEG
jgi:hypothetical protein